MSSEPFLSSIIPFAGSLSMYIDTSAVGLESGPVGETNVPMLIGMPDAFDSCTLQSDGNRSRIPFKNWRILYHGRNLQPPACGLFPCPKGGGIAVQLGIGGPG